MDELILKRLKVYVEEYGKEAIVDKKRCESYLKDFCGEQKKEIFMIALAIEEGIPEKLFELSREELLFDVGVRKSTESLVEKRGLSEDSANWAVSAWLYALSLEGKDDTVYVKKERNDYEDMNTVIQSSPKGEEISETPRQEHQYKSQTSFENGNKAGYGDSSKNSKLKLVLGVGTFLLATSIAIVAIGMSGGDSSQFEQSKLEAVDQDKVDSIDSSEDSKGSEVEDTSIANNEGSQEKSKDEIVQKPKTKINEAEYIFPYSHSSYLSKSDLDWIKSEGDPGLLRLAINEIYARHGMTFKGEENRNYFNTKSWYSPNARTTEGSQVESQFNDFERSNVDSLASIESQINSRQTAAQSSPSSSDYSYDIEQLVVDYGYNLVTAINHNDFSIVAPTLVPGSSLYGKQINLIRDLNAQGITQEMLDFRVLGITGGSGGSYEVRTYEKVRIYYGDGSVKVKDFYWTYSVLYNSQNAGLTDIK